MRIIAGEARGRRLVAPVGLLTRPTADRTREALFNILARRVPDARVLDLFAGSGALALEALSRGAAFAWVNDPERAARNAILQNAKAVLGEDFKDRLHLSALDYKVAAASAEGRYDLVFLDPPYAMLDAYGSALSLLAENGRLAPGGLVVLECAKESEIAVPDGFRKTDERVYGAARVLFVEAIP